MKNWLIRLFTVLGPGVAVMSALIISDPEPHPVFAPLWRVFIFIMIMSLMISLPQIVWCAVGISGLLSDEVYWGGLIAAQTWMIVNFIVLARYANIHLASSNWFYYSVCCVVLLLGALCGFLFRKFRHKEAAA